MSVRWELNGGLIDEGELLSLCAQPWVRGDVVTVYVTTETATASTSVTIANSPPGVVNVELKPPRLARNFDVTAIIAAQDPDSDKISTTCRWFINGSEVPGVTGTVLPGTQIHKGDQIVFEVVPSDGEIQGETFRSNTATVRNSAPSFASMPPERLSGFLYTYAARAIDPDDDPLTYTLEEGPPGMTIDEQSGKLEWQITLDNVGSYTVRIVASDTDGEKAEQEFPLRVGKVNE
ncbi:MAG: hypothetical protein A2091_00415 [Desulfuromonadales bacterium GWD2_61_12]|nr:MAG: hypothetical protein A2005_08440 [Desulfuromonadales bacterium GWC2_61_20]OGR32731.1 MAG: hypothetical protein A2091_00415 [Desulfuromonadales bacterium GWD2_61_12]HAD05450.1 hypothetical protein [Desulfuromonas sp.]